MTSEILDFQVQEPPEKEATTQTEGPEQNEAGSQTEEFDYRFMPTGYQAPDQEYFDSYAKVRFYASWCPPIVPLSSNSPFRLVFFF